MADTTYGRIILALGGLVGGAGVALAAAASHVGDQHLLGSASTICLAHGPALLALALSGMRSRALQAAVGLLGIGTLLFAGDLLVRYFTGSGLFTGAAPIGGGVMIVGWLAVVLGAFSRSK